MLSNRFLIKCWGPLCGALFFFSTSVFAEVKFDQQWLNLLHYNKTIFGGYRSEADGMDFFLSEKGKTDPQAEINSLIVALDEDNSDPKKNAYCRFPARVRWLKKFKSDLKSSKVKCEKLDAYRNRIAARSVSIVFSSYYLNNPSSSFGHTFLRFGKNPLNLEDDKVATELLDTGVNFGAVTGDAGALLYVFGGLAGFFPGTFNAIPYYYKVREYNDFETRDLWSYELNFSQDEIDIMVDHVWELGHTYFRYFFLTENCSYHILTILEGARPTLDLRSDVPYLYTIPGDTIKIVAKNKLIERVSFRPAPSTMFYHQLSLLNKEEEQKVLDIFNHKDGIVFNETSERKALIYDTALSLVDYKFAKNILKNEEKAQAFKRPILVERAKIPVRSPKLDFTYKMPEAPHLGHASRRLTLGGYNQKGKMGADLEWRFAYHDLLDFSPAYPYRTKLEVARINARITDRQFELRELAAMDILSLGKFDKFNRAPSWKMRIGHSMTKFNQSFYGTQGLTAGYGYSYHMKYFVPYSLLHGEVGYVSEKLHRLKFAYGADAGILFDFAKSFKIHSSFDFRVHPWNETKWNNEFRFTNQYYGVGAYYSDYLLDGFNEFGAKFYFYL